jgi:hypothetical protein
MPMAGAKNSAAPTPSRNLEAIKIGKLGDNPSPIPERERRSIPSWEVFFGPQRAEATPAGIWNIPAPARNEAVRIPRDGRSTPNSMPIRKRAGEMLNQLIV